MKRKMSPLEQKEFAVLRGKKQRCEICKTLRRAGSLAGYTLREKANMKVVTKQVCRPCVKKYGFKGVRLV